VIDVVGAKAGADQLLEQVCLFVGALSRAKAGNRTRSVLITDRNVPKGSEYPYPDPAKFFIPRWKSFGYSVS